MAGNTTRYSYLGIAALFVLSGIVTSVFSGSLAALAANARLVRGLSLWWPVSWCLTICTNMAIFVWASRHWWETGM